jgi:hypothetical protein
MVATDGRDVAVANANLTGPVMADRLISHLNRILQRTRKRGPYVYVITPDGRTVARVTSVWVVCVKLARLRRRYEPSLTF